MAAASEVITVANPMGPELLKLDESEARILITELRKLCHVGGLGRLVIDDERYNNFRSSLHENIEPSIEKRGRLVKCAYTTCGVMMLNIIGVIVAGATSQVLREKGNSEASNGTFDFFAILLATLAVELLALFFARRKISRLEDSASLAIKLCHIDFNSGDLTRPMDITPEIFTTRMSTFLNSRVFEEITLFTEEKEVLALFKRRLEPAAPASEDIALQVIANPLQAGISARARTVFVPLYAGGEAGSPTGHATIAAASAPAPV